MTLTCAIIDDEPLAISLLESYVDKTPFLRLTAKFNSALEALPVLSAQPVELLFLDIQMPELSGMEFSRILEADTRIIFTTAFEQYALDSYKVNALDYLLKPVSYADFMKSVGKAIEWQTMRDAMASQTKSVPDMLTVKADYRLIQMRMDSIRYIEVQKDRVIFYRTDGEPVSSLMSMRELEETLPSDIFMRVHRSFIVNLRRIEIVERNRIVFGKTYIPISESKRDEFLDRLRN